MPDSDRSHGPEQDRWNASDLPLSSIPTARRSTPPPPPPGPGAGRYLLGAAIAFLLIVFVSVIAAPYLHNPLAERQLEAERIAADARGAVDAGAAPDGAGGAPLPATTPPAAAVRAPVLAAPAPMPTMAPPVAMVAPTGIPQSDPAPSARNDVELAALRRDLAAKEAALVASQRELETERKGRSDDARARTAASERDKKELDKLKQSEAARVGQLAEAEAEAQRLKAEQASAAAAAAAHLAELQAALDANQNRASSAESTLEARNSQYERQLQGESEAVRKLLGDLTRARDDLSREQKARRVADDRVRQLESELTTAIRSGSASTSSGSAPTAAGSDRSPTGGGADEQPERIKTIPPRYPEDLRSAGIDGRVLLRVLVDELGNVADVELDSSPHPRLTQVAERAARQWKYKPARRDGVRVQVWVIEAVDFKL